ncbi:hypothetical protein ATL42_3136 [Sanguibacter antarcticus]|uniref:Lipoprotein n=2 Tax=Sanguibacter antarcticus TaxID=372484 RepID=A0A2A9E8C3_9MICO|nr:hypothetical protein ATL42_3136 [Sanguibacter antarcticus]
MNRKSLVAASGATLLLATLLTGCGSSGGDVEAFCDDAGAIVDGSFLDDVDANSTDDPAAVYDTALERVDKVDPPSDIEEDWTMTTEAMHTYLEGMADLDPESDTYSDDMDTLMGTVDQESLQTASDNIETYLSENCEA